MGAAALLAAACGGSSPGGTSKSITVGNPGPARVTPQSNQAATEAEAQRLLSLAVLPPGASSTSIRPKALYGPSMGTPSDSSLIDKAKYWRVEESADATYRLISASAPKGLKKSGSSTGSGPGGITDQGIDWSEPDRAYATELQLDESVTSDGANAAIIRADGMGIWLDPRPYRDDRAGARMRITVAGGCPKSRGEDVGVTNTGADLDQVLLPNAAPTAGLICQFGGLNAKPPSGLAGKVTLSAAAARRVADQANRLPLAHTGRGDMSCPMDDGGIDVVALSYAGRPDVDLWYYATGCAFISNGHILVDGGLTLTHWIARSVGPL